MFGPTRGFSGMVDSMEPCKMLWDGPLLQWPTKFGQICAIFFTKSPVSRLVCQIDGICLGLPGEMTRGPISVAMATTFALGAESNHLPTCSPHSIHLKILV